MKASIFIRDPHRVQTKGLSLFAAQTAAAYEIDLVYLRDQSGPRRAVGGLGDGGVGLR